MPITKGFRQLVDEANAQITTYSVEQVRARLDDPTVQIVDIRDVRELEREGAGWRSALAAKALKDMGMTNVAHIDGGFAEWVKQAAPVENYEAHRARRHPAK